MIRAFRTLTTDRGAQIKFPYVFVPKVTQAQRLALNAEDGMIVFQTDNVPNFYYYNAGWATF